MARLLMVVGIGLATAVAGCLTPQGYDRPDGGQTATGGAQAQGGSSSAGGATGAAGTTGAGGSVVPGTGGAATGTGGSAVGTGGSAAGGKGGTGALGGKGGTGALGGATGQGGAVVGTGGSVSSTGAAGASGCAVSIPLPYTEDFESDMANLAPPTKQWIFDTIDSDPSKGTFTVVSDGGSNVLEGATTSSDFIMIVGGDQCWTDYTFQVDIKFISGSSEEFGVFGRFGIGSGGKGAYYEAYMDNSSAVQLRVRQNGSTTTLGSKSKPTTSGSPVAGMVYTFVLDMHGSTISVSVNGTPRVSMVMDTTLTTGSIGLMVNDGTVEFDNIKVTQ
jgi:hypothetical protein